MRRVRSSVAARAALLISFVLAAALLSSQTSPPERVGPLPNGGFLLNSGWKIQPAGKQIALDTLPMATALSPDGKYLLVLNGGYRPPSISVIDTASAKVTGSAPVADGWLGMAFAPKSNRVYVGGGSRAAVFEFTLNGGTLTPGRTFALAPPDRRTANDFVGDVAFSPDGRLLYAAELYRNTIAVINPLSGIVIDRIKTGRRPYKILFHPDGKSFFVSHWADGSVGHYDVDSGGQLTVLRVAPHPTDLLWRDGDPREPQEGEPRWAGRLFVAAANTNSVYAIGVTEGKDLKIAENINVAMTPMQPAGMTPSALALSADGKQLFVVCSDANAAAVVNVSEDRSRVDGFIPTGWYPTAARSLASGTLVILNGKGVRSYPNPLGPNPTRRPEPVHEGAVGSEYVTYIQTGTASWIDPFSSDQLAAWTSATLANSGYSDAKLMTSYSLPPIEHVIYIVKENRSYDQVLGDMKQGNGDPKLTLFGENATPNQHKIARQFALFDNFYVNSDVSADGHNWSTAAIAPDYVQKLWPNSYAQRRSKYDYEEGDPASTPPAGYLWSNVAQAGLSLRNFGYMAENKPLAATGAEQIASVRDPVLAPVTNRRYRGFDLDYPDADRAKIFLEDLAAWERSGQMPRLSILRLGNDHTSGTTPGKIAPLSAVADNDYALGMIVEAVSKSKFWTSTAIFVLEDDAQNGPDHVDSHRSPAFVISAYVKRGVVDSTMYNTTSMLRTMEAILHLRPMTHFDAGARPMTAVFQANPDPAPYAAEKPRIALDAKNPPDAPGAADSRKMDFDEADRIDDDKLNAILWQAIRPGAPPPAPVRSLFGR